MLSFLAKIIIPFALSSTLFSTNKDHSKPIQQPLCANLETCQIIDLKNEALNKWNLKLFNPTNSVVGAQYNTKMCFEDDAKSWTGLNNLQTVAINYHSFAEITISENWFATTIAASYIANSAGINERLITYANNLNLSKKTLSEYAIYRVE